MTENKTVAVVLWKEQARKLEDQLGLKMVGDVADINAEVIFEKLSAAGRSKILVTIHLGEAVK